jgi:hypothetical protein
MNLKHGKKPTLKQMAIMQKNKLDPNLWLVIKALPDKLVCVNRIDGKTKNAFLKVAAI